VKECDSIGVREICEDFVQGHSLIEENLVRETNATPGCFLENVRNPKKTLEIREILRGKTCVSV
jgi:hypothetical protein